VYSDTSTLLDNFELRGKWWLPDKPLDRVHGTLAYSPQGIRLQLDGKFDRPEFRHPLVAMRVPKPECILGETVNGERCTLYKTFASQIAATNTLVVLVANALVVGEHFNSSSDLGISGALLHFINLEEWTSFQPWQQEKGADSGHFRVVLPTDSKRMFTIPETPRFRELALVVGVQSSLSALAFNARTRAHFDCEFRDPVQLREVQGMVGQLANLLSLLQGEPTHAKQIRLKINDPGQARRTANLFYVHRAREPRVIDSHEMKLPFTKLAGDTEALFRSWFTNERALEPVYDLLVGTIYNSQQSVYTTFLTLAHAVESFHRRVCGGAYTSESNYEPIRNSLWAAIPPDLADDFQGRLKNAVKYGYQYSLRTRLRGLLKTLDERTIEAIVREKPQGFISLVVAVRNYLTHYDEGDKPTIVDDPVGVHNLNERLRGLLTVLLLTHLGVPEKKASDAIVSHMDLAT
jgi:hypothetical protein